MGNLREAIHELTGRELSSDDVKRLNDIARHFGWKQNDPLVDIVMILDAENRLLAEGFKKIPMEVESVLEKMRDAGSRELALCEEKMKISSELLQSKIISDIVPQISQRVSETAAAKIAEANTVAKKELLNWQLAVMIGLCAVCFGFGLLEGAKIIKLPQVQLAVSSIAANSLFEAIRDNANPWLLKKLISNGINVNIVNEYGNTPLLSAIKQNANVDTVNALIEAGADVNAMDNDRATPLLCSLMDRNMKPEQGVISALISAGADVNVQYGTEGVTPLMLAAVNGNSDPEIVSALVKAGANIGAKNRISGKTTIDYARENPALKDNAAVMKLLGKK